jgi:DNA modification methylase
MKYPDDFVNKIIQGDALEIIKQIPDETIDTIITSPPYWGLRDYGVEGQIGLEKTPEEYVEKLVNIFREARRILKKTGTLWLNLGDTYMSGSDAKRHWGYPDPKYQNGRGIDFLEPQSFKHPILKQKDLVGIPWRVAFALQQDGWYLRQDIIWAKPNPMPESVKDRCTKSHEYIFLLSKSPKYYFDNEAIKEPISESYAKDKRPHGIIRERFYPNSKYVKEGLMDLQTGEFPTQPRSETRNKRDVWWITTKPFKGAHFATFPEDLVEPMILAGCPTEGIVLDPFMGSGTTAVVAKKLGRNYIGIELNPKYIQLAEERIKNTQTLL